MEQHSDAQELQRRNRELSILNIIAQALNRSVDLEQTLHAALAQAADLLDLHTGWIWLLDEASGDSYLAATQNLPPGLANHPELMEGSCYCLDTYQAGDLNGAANVNVVTCSRLKKLVGGTAGLRYHASIPLYAHGKQLGVLNLASTDWRELSQADLRLLYTVGDLLSIAIERARLFAQSAEFGAVSERNRLAREIHDTLAQGLAGIVLQLETAEVLLGVGDKRDKVERSIHQALELARSNLDEARRSVLDLRAAPLESRSLADALTALVKAAEEQTSAFIRLHVTGANRPLPVRIETGLYRIAQEAVANAVQHASASQITISLELGPRQAKLVVEDDGKGFDPAQTPSGHFGLIGLNERARLFGGQLHLESEPGVGTRVEVSVPI
jgi:two-component system NarL family sensor kinase